MRRNFILVMVAVGWLLAPAAGLRAQETAQPEADPRPEGVARPKPDMGELERLRFVTDTDYPPFNYVDEDGTLIGFNVDLARAICEELAVECAVRPLAWDELLPALADNQADTVIASLRVDEDTLGRADFSDSYYHTPARFVARKANPIDSVKPESLKGRRIGVVSGTAHEAFLRDFFSAATIVSFGDAEAAKEAVRSGAVDLLFGDGISLMFWLNGSASNACCEFRGGPFTESKYFGEGVGIAVRHGDRKMRDILDYGLEQVRASGRFEELLLRYFPMSIF